MTLLNSEGRVEGREEGGVWEDSKKEEGGRVISPLKSIGEGPNGGRAVNGMDLECVGEAGMETFIDGANDELALTARGGRMEAVGAVTKLSSKPDLMSSLLSH